MSTHGRPSFARGFLLTATVLGLGAAPAWAQSGGLQKSSPKVIAAFREVVSKPGDCVVRIKCAGKEAALGTIVAADGWILTKHSEVKGTPICHLKDGREFEACVVSVDDRFDLALIKIECTGLKAVEWCESKCAPVGNWVASAGPGNDPVAIGVVSVAARNVPVSKTPVRPTPSPTSGYLGVSLAIEADNARIEAVSPGSAAEKAGLKANDVVLAVGKQAIKDSNALIDTLQRHKAGEVVMLKIQREDKELDLKVTLGKRPANANRGDFQNNLGSVLSSVKAGFPTILQHDTVIKPSDCGGPLVDLDGRVIGINIARAGRTESYAVPAEVVKPMLSKLMPEKITTPRRAD